MSMKQIVFLIIGIYLAAMLFCVYASWRAAGYKITEFNNGQQVCVERKPAQTWTKDRIDCIRY